MKTNVFGISDAKATRQEKYCINNKNPQPTSANKLKRQTANKRHEKWPRIGANAKRYFCIFRHALCSCQFLPAALPLPPLAPISTDPRSVYCAKVKTTCNRLQTWTKKPEKENQFCENYWMCCCLCVGFCLVFSYLLLLYLLLFAISWLHSFADCWKENGNSSDR